MKILVIGGTGMLGHKLVQFLGTQFDVWATIRQGSEQLGRYGIFEAAKIIPNIDVGAFSDVRDAIARVRPDVVVNAVGIIKQLPSSKDVVTTLEINSIFPHRLAELSEELGFRLICISTDCVFSGDKGNYTEDDIPDARDLYGKSKNLGEVSGTNCLTLRTSIIGRELGTAHSLVDWFLSNRGGSVKGYVNAIYSGFPTVVFADIIAELVGNHQDLNGLYHVSSDPINKYDLLSRINDAFGANVRIERFEDFRIDRSLDSTRFRKATGFTPPSWDEMIARMAADATPYNEWKI